MKQPRWLGTAEASRMTGLAIRTLQEYAEDGRLPSYKPGRHVLFLEDELKDFMFKHRRPAVGEAKCSTGA